ncbi:hypothetical protein Tco_0965472 [Tanacetum coccineum]
MTTLADKSLLSGGDNKPPMLEKHLYDSWKSRMELYMMNRPHGRMILASVEKGPLVWPSITEDGVTRLKEYVELTPAEAIQADCDIKAINIILQGLPTEIYALVSQHRVAKDLWEKIKLLMQGTSLTKQERECKLYDEFDKFTYKKGETLHEYYLRQKFVTDVKLVKDLHTTNVDQLHAYLQQHERHANEVRLMHERNSDPLTLSSQFVTPYQTQQFTTNQSTPLSITYPSNEYQSTVHHNVYSPQPSIPQLEYAPTTYQQQQPEFSQPDSGLVVLVFQKGDDPIDAINHMMSFLTAVVTSRKTNSYALEQRENTHLVQVEATRGNNGLSSVTIAKGRVILPSVSTKAQEEIGTKNVLQMISVAGSSSSRWSSFNRGRIAFSDRSSTFLTSNLSTVITQMNGSMPTEKLKKILTKTSIQYLVLKELADVQIRLITKWNGFEQHRLGVQNFEVKMNQVFSENERLLAQAIDNDIVKTVVNLSVNEGCETVNECQRCLKLKTELLNKKDFVDKETYDKLCKSFTTLEKHCITLEADSQLNQENFQLENGVLKSKSPSFTHII